WRHGEPCDAIPRATCGDELPELAQLPDPGAGSIAGNERGIHRADRDARDPVRREMGFRQRLVDTRLIRAQSTAALQEQRNAFEGRPGELPVALAGGSIGCHMSGHDRDSRFPVPTVCPRYEQYA